MTTVLWILGIVVAAGLGFALGAGRRKEDPRTAALGRMAAELGSGRLPEAPGDEWAEPLRSLRSALERGWSPRNEEREEALRQALGRIAAFLRENVAAPLGAARGGTPEQLADAVVRALGGLEDLEFFLREPLTPDETHNLTPIVQQVTREFITDWEAAVRFSASDRPVRAHIHRDTFMDAVYLLLHNAGQFGGGGTVDVTVDEDGGEARVRIRDRGPGFTAEALERAHDLFYTTASSGLGLGIPFARKIVESFGGDVHLRNRPEGGAEVELRLPAA